MNEIFKRPKFWGVNIFFWKNSDWKRISFIQTGFEIHASAQFGKPELLFFFLKFFLRKYQENLDEKKLKKKFWGQMRKSKRHQTFDLREVWKRFFSNWLKEFRPNSGKTMDFFFRIFSSQIFKDFDEDYFWQKIEENGTFSDSIKLWNIFSKRILLQISRFFNFVFQKKKYSEKLRKKKFTSFFIFSNDFRSGFTI